MKNAFHISLCFAAMLLLSQHAAAQGFDPAARFRLAQALEQAGEYERAAKAYQELVRQDSLNLLFFDGLQRVLLQLKRYDEASDLIRRRLVRTPGDVGLHAALGSVLAKSGRLKEADEAWEEALSVDPANPNVYRLVANVLVENRLLDKAAEIYRRGRSAVGDPSLFTLELASLLVASMDYGGATDEYLGWLAHNPGQLTIVESRLSVFSWKPEGRTAAIESVNKALGRKDDVHLQELLGWLYVEGKDYERALEVYRTIDRATNAQGASLLDFANRASHDREYSIAAKAYREAIAAPLSAAAVPAAMLGYATTLMELSTSTDSVSAPVPSTEEVVKEFHEIIRRFPGTEVAARAYYQVGVLRFQRLFDLHGALASFARIGSETPAPNTLRYDAALRVGEIRTALGDTVAAADQYRRVAAAPDATPDQADEAQFRLAELDFFADHFAQAGERLNTIALNPNADYANDALTLKSLLDENASAGPALSAFARADLLARQRRESEAMAVYADIIARYPQSPCVDDALMALANLQANAGMYQKALASYEQLLTQFKESSVSLDRAQFRKAEILETGLKQKDQAIAAFEKLLEAYPRSVLANQARQRIRQLRGELP